MRTLPGLSPASDIATNLLRLTRRGPSGRSGGNISRAAPQLCRLLPDSPHGLPLQLDLHTSKFLPPNDHLAHGNYEVSLLHLTQNGGSKD